MPPTTTTKDDYVTPHISDERLRRSVMAAQAGRTSVRDVYEREARRPPSRWRRPFKPEFDEESFSSALGFIEVVVEGLCVEGAGEWVERDLGVERSDRAVGWLLFSFFVLFGAGGFGWMHVICEGGSLTWCSCPAAEGLSYHTRGRSC